MKKIRLMLPFVLLFILVFFDYASAATHEELVAKYIEMSGIGDMLKSIPGELDSLTSQKNLTSRNPEIGNKVYQIMKDTFDAGQAEKNMTAYLLRNTDRKFLEEMLQWLESPVALKITKEEVNSSGAERQSNMLRYLADMKLNPPTQDRINAIQGVEQATQTSDLMTKIMMDIIKGMMESITLALPEDKRESIDDSYEEFVKMQPTLKEAFRQQIIMSSFYTYRNISNEELNIYSKFYQSELGQKEVKITGAAVGDVLKQWFDEVAKKLAVLAKEESGKGI